MIKKLSLALITGSLLLGISSCKKDSITPNRSASVESETFAGQAKNNGTIWFTRCPNVKKQNLGCDIWYAGKANDPSGASYGVDDVRVYVLFSTTGPTPLVDVFTIDEFTYSEDGEYQIFQTPNDFVLFDPNGPSPIGHKYTILSEAVDANGVVIESMECEVKITEPFQKAPKGIKTKVVEGNNGTAELQVVVNPRDYIVLDWKSSDKITISYDQLSSNPLLHAGNEYTLNFAGMKPNGNLLFKTTLTGALEYSPSLTTSIEEKWSITDELVDPFSLIVTRTATQESFECSVEGMRLIDKGLNTYINSVTAHATNNGGITVKVKRSQKALVQFGNTVSYAKISLTNKTIPIDPHDWVRYESFPTGEGILEYNGPNDEELIAAGIWDFDGDGLNDYSPKITYKLVNLGGNNGVAPMDPEILGTNDSFNVTVELFDHANNSMGTVPFYSVIVE